MDIVGDRLVDSLDNVVNFFRIKSASNAAFKIELATGESFIYKPESGERPLWDFEAGTLMKRELLSSIFLHEMGISVPRTRLLQNGPYGIGLLQDWITSEEIDLFKVLPAELELPGWLRSFRGYDQSDAEVILWHESNNLIRSIAFGDLVINNADRKGGHLLKSAGGIWPIDHGLTFHHEPKLRTIFWGWANSEFNMEEIARLDIVEQLASSTWVSDLISDLEIEALMDRIAQLRAAGRFPAPPLDRAAIPWPIY